MAHNTLASYDYVDDVARTEASGVWHTPTDKEWKALLDSDHYTWTWTDDYNGSGIKRTSRKPFL